MNTRTPSLTALKPVDPLGEALHFLRMSGSFYCLSEFTAPWGLELPAFESCLMIHIVTSGECVLEVDSVEHGTLRTGDLALVPHGGGHRLLSATGARSERLFALPRELISDRYERLLHGGGGTPTTMVCGAMRFDHPAAQHLIRMLPKVIKVDVWSSSEAEWVQSTLRLLTAEAQTLRAGGETIITRLADILVIQAIRSWIARDPASQSGWLGALRDKQIGRAIALIHREPARNWTVASLAGAVAMSRSAFSARFTQLVGESAMHYATRWQMNAALMWLREDGATVAQLATRLGYESEAAFSRAFKRFMGVPPGAARQRPSIGAPS